jgi:hypothetical protein
MIAPRSLLWCRGSLPPHSHWGGVFAWDEKEIESLRGALR